MMNQMKRNGMEWNGMEWRKNDKRKRERRSRQSECERLPSVSSPVQADVIIAVHSIVLLCFHSHIIILTSFAALFDMIVVVVDD